MSQEFQQIGQVSPALDAVADEKQGWGTGLPGDVIKPQQELGEQQINQQDYSFRSDRANLQHLGWSGGESMAAHQEMPMAARDPRPSDVPAVANEAAIYPDADRRF